MKRIKIQPPYDLTPIKEFGKNRGKYSVCIYWEKRFYFNSKRDALRFIAITNQFLTRAMYRARLIYADVLNKYIRDWGYFEHDKPSMDPSLFDMERNCRAALRDAEDCFDLMASRSHWDNGSFITFHQLMNVSEYLTSAIKVLRELSERRNSSMDLYMIDKLTEDVHTLDISLKCFGRIESESLTKPRMHNHGLPPSMIEATAKILAVA